MEIVTIPREKLEKMQQELAVLRNSKLYRRLLDFEKNIVEGNKYMRKDLGF